MIHNKKGSINPFGVGLLLMAIVIIAIMINPDLINSKLTTNGQDVASEAIESTVETVQEPAANAADNSKKVTGAVSTTAIAALAIIMSNMMFASGNHRRKRELDFLDIATMILGPLGVLLIAIFS